MERNIGGESLEGFIYKRSVLKRYGHASHGFMSLVV